MPELISADVQTLRTTVTGEVLAPHDPGYDEARAVWNGDIDKHPAVIVRCASATDVSAAIGFARSRNLEISVRGGAHSMAGNSVTHGGLEIDLSAMRTVTVDPVAQRASSVVEPPWRTVMPPPRHTGWRPRAGSWGTPESAGSPSAVAWGG